MRVYDQCMLAMSCILRGLIYKENKHRELIIYFKRANKLSGINNKHVELIDLDKPKNITKIALLHTNSIRKKIILRDLKANYRSRLTDHVSKSAALITNNPPMIVHIFTRSLSKRNAKILPYKGCKQEINPAVVADK